MTVCTLPFLFLVIIFVLLFFCFFCNHCKKGNNEKTFIIIDNFSVVLEFFVGGLPSTGKVRFSCAFLLVCVFFFVFCLLLVCTELYFSHPSVHI